MLFSGDEVQKRVGVLSGGERARLALAKGIARRNNCLLLDEPTNNLDIIAKETLLEALRRFPGTVLIVSHDRYILNELATEVIEVGHGHAIRYLGNYDDYLAKKIAKDAPPNGAGPAAGSAVDTPPAAADDNGAVAANGDGAAPASGNGRDGGVRQPRNDPARQADREAQR